MMRAWLLAGFLGATLLHAEPPANVSSALSAFGRSDWKNAKAGFEEWLKVRPDDPAATANLGITEYHLGNKPRALELLRKAVRLAPEAAPAWLVLGMIHYEKEELDAALAALSQAVLYEPGNAQAHNFLGVTIGLKGWRDGAEQELQKAVELDPNYGDAHFNLAVFYLERNPPAIELARRHYEKARDLGQSADALVEKRLNEAK